jgi:hypothetical protein
VQVAEGSRLRGASRIIGVDINSEKFIKGISFLYKKKKEKGINIGSCIIYISNFLSIRKI